MVSVSQRSLFKFIGDSVKEGLDKVGLPDTPHNRVGVLNGMYSRVLNQGELGSEDRLILQPIEDEIVRLESES